MKGIFNTLCQFLRQQQACLLCRQQSATLICQVCVQDIDCFPVANWQHNLLLWPQAAKGLKQVHFDQLLAITDYHWPLASLLTGLKFSGKTVHALALAQLFEQFICDNLPHKPDFLLPVPLHWSRLLARKYNQSELIAKHLGQRCHIPVRTDLIARTKATQAQTRLNAQQRRHNLKQAFTLLQPFAATHVAIFDDVVTTGSTVNSLSQLLKQHSPGLQVQVWTLCLTLEH